MESKVLISFALIVLLTGCRSSSSIQTTAPGPKHHQTGSGETPQGEFAARLYVKGMSCPLCANNIDKQLLRVPGVQHVSVDLGTGLVLARLAPVSPPSREQLVEAIQRSGFTLDRIEMPQLEGGRP